MLNVKCSVDEVVEGLQKYWDYRSTSYSSMNIEELNDFRGKEWLRILLSNAPKKENLKVLDVGAGPGLFSILMSLAGHKVTAVDVSNEMIEKAKENSKLYDVNINFVQVNGINLPFEDKSFDLIISRNVLWNLEYPKEALKEWKRLLSEDGHIVYFDANHYLHLFDEKQKKSVEEDRRNMEIKFKHKHEVTPETKSLESIAQKLYLSDKRRPSWDINALKECGYKAIKVQEDLGRYVWDEKQRVEERSRPLFMIVAK